MCLHIYIVFSSSHAKVGEDSMHAHANKRPSFWVAFQKRPLKLSVLSFSLTVARPCSRKKHRSVKWPGPAPHEDFLPCF